MPEQVWQFVWLIAGAAITVTTTYAFNRNLEYKQQKKLAMSLFVKAFSATNDVSTLRRDLNSQLVRFRTARGVDPAPSEMWTAITPFVGVPNESISFTGEELAILGNDGEAINKLLEFLSFRRVLLESTRTYCDMRSRLGESLEMLTTFQIDESGMVGNTAVNLRERPDLARAIGEANKLCRDVLRLAEEAETVARRVCDLVNQKVPAKFKSGEFTLRMEMPRAS